MTTPVFMVADWSLVFLTTPKLIGQIVLEVPSSMTVNIVVSQFPFLPTYQVYRNDVITEPFAYVIVGQKNAAIIEPPPPWTLNDVTSVTQLKIIENTKTHDC